MSSDLLPESVNLFLDDFETSLCLPILVVMVLCTVQFVFNHVFDIGWTIYQNIRKRIAKGEEQDAKTTMEKLKGMLTTLGIGKADTVNVTAIKNPLSPTIQSREEEWDYCEDDVE